MSYFEMSRSFLIFLMLYPIFIMENDQVKKYFHLILYGSYFGFQIYLLENAFYYIKLNEMGFIMLVFNVQKFNQLINDFSLLDFKSKIALEQFPYIYTLIRIKVAGFQLSKLCFIYYFVLLTSFVLNY